jgi:predicted  nucleic acid-binding Zn-ribbon protein
MTLNKFHLIFLAVYTAVVVFITWYFNQSENTNDTGLTVHTQEEVDSLNNYIIKLELQQTLSDSTIIKYQHDLSELDDQINTTQRKIVQIRERYEKNITKVSNYTNTQLDSFFTNRYPN